MPIGELFSRFNREKRPNTEIRQKAREAFLLLDQADDQQAKPVFNPDNTIVLNNYPSGTIFRAKVLITTEVLGDTFSHTHYSWYALFKGDDVIYLCSPNKFILRASNDSDQFHITSLENSFDVDVLKADLKEIQVSDFLDNIGLGGNKYGGHF